jgi:UDP-N-acetylmuramate dehydrogenase
MTVFNGLDEIVQRDYPLGKATTIGVGGNAEYFAVPRTEEELREVLVRAEKAGIAVRVLGRGSNLLVRDEGVPGVVVHLDPAGFGQVAVEDDLLRAGAATPLAKVVAEAARSGLGGVECLVGIPGSVGGAVRMNAGGAHGDVGQTVERVKVMDAHGQIFSREREDLLFGYRTSNVTARFILEAELRLMPDTPRAITARMKRIWIAKKNSQPMNAASAGCVFKNPRGLSAGMMIDQCGLKGTSVSGAVVSRKHANYIVVKGKSGAKAADVLALIELVRNAVKERFSVSLELEIEIWP